MKRKNRKDFFTNSYGGFTVVCHSLKTDHDFTGHNTFRKNKFYSILSYYLFCLGLNPILC